MQLRAASRVITKDGGWDAALGLSLLAAVLGALMLVVVVAQGPANPPQEQGQAPSKDAAPNTAAAELTVIAAAERTSLVPPSSTRSGASIRAQATTRPATTAAPVATFGRSLTLVEDDPLRDSIRDALGDNADHFSVVVVRQSDGRAALIDADREFYAASLFKLAVLYEAGLRLSRAELGLGDRLFLSEEDTASDLGTLQYVTLDDEGALTVVDALEMMVTLSDNSIAVALLHVFTGSRIDQSLRGLGIETTSVNTTALPTTARDMARIMVAILAGEGLDTPTHDLLLGMLSRQHTRDGIPSGLPDGVQSGNKTGTWESATHDVAWVAAPSGPYVIAILSDTNRDWATMAAVSAAVYESLESE